MELKISPINFEDCHGPYKPLALKALDEAKTMSFSISNKEQEQFQVASALASLVPLEDLRGYLGRMYFFYCNWQTKKISLIIVDVNDYNNKGSKYFTFQLLKILYERTENEKKVTNNE